MATSIASDHRLALQGGPKAVAEPSTDITDWPIVTDEDKAAVLEVLSRGAMSNWDVTREFEREWAAYNGVRYAIAYPNGTAAIFGALYGAGVGYGHEVIAPAHTFWASITQVYSLGATPVFADIHPQTLCLDPAGIEKHITPRTKAIVVVHYNGHPADMDAIMAIARKHDLRVVEDVSRAQGSMYKGRMCGSIGDAAGASMMSGKAFPIGEGGMLMTNDREVYERAVCFSHTASHLGDLTMQKYIDCEEIPLGGFKGRLNQLASAMGRVQLRHYAQRIAEIQRAVNRFWQLLEGVPGLRPHRATWPDSDMGGWFYPLGHYAPEELGGLPVKKFVEAVAAEGAIVRPTWETPLHLKKIFNSIDIYGHGKPTRLAFADRDIRQGIGSMPVAEGILQRTLMIPWFKHDRSEEIAQQAAAYRKVALRASDLLK